MLGPPRRSTLFPYTTLFRSRHPGRQERRQAGRRERQETGQRDRKSTRLNSSHLVISYAVFCLKKKSVSGKSRVRHPAINLEPKFFGRDDHTSAGSVAEAIFDEPRSLILVYFAFFFFNDTAPTEIYTLSLHDALPISSPRSPLRTAPSPRCRPPAPVPAVRDRKSTRLNSSHLVISYAVFCLKKKKKYNTNSHLKQKQRKRQ